MIQFINAHAYTAPSPNKVIYYWARLIEDPVWGISGFLYLDTGTAEYYAVASYILFESAQHAIANADVEFGPDKIPAVLKVEFTSAAKAAYASYSIIETANPLKVLDCSLSFPISPRSKITIKAMPPKHIITRKLTVA